MSAACGSDQNRRQSGFSLLEIAIVLTVIGIVLGMGLQAATRFAESESIDLTEARLDAIEAALVLYVSRNGRLPCPSAADAAADSAAWGDEIARSGDVCTGTTGDAVRGVPWRELGLTADYALDGWRRRISYFVFQDAPTGAISLVKDGALDATDCVFDAVGMAGATVPDCTGNPAFQDFLIDRGFRVQDENGVDILFPDGWERGGGAAFVLVSHGADGCGAYDQSGDPLTACNIASAQADNSDYDTRFVEGPINQSTDPEDYFDDHIRFLSVHALVDKAKHAPSPPS